MHTSISSPLLAACFALTAAHTSLSAQLNFGEAQPFALVANQGQWDAKARFFTSRGDASAWFLDSGFVFHLRGLDRPAQTPSGGSGQPQDTRPAAQRRLAQVLAVDFLGHNQTLARARARLPGVYNFYQGPRSRWRQGVPTYAEISYPELYPGIELRIRQGQGLFAYDLHCAAGADISKIALNVRGAAGMRQDEAGHIHLRTPLGTLRHSAPKAWQLTADGPKALACEAVLDGSQIRFAVPGRDPSLPLLIDPDWTWGTLFGGANWEIVRGLKPTGSGPDSPVLMAGTTYSTTLPVSTGQTYQGSGDAFVALFDPKLNGTAQRVWATLIGGTDTERLFDLDVDVLGNCYIGGITRSSSFPTTTTTLQSTYGGGNSDAFLCKLSRTGALTMSSFLGGNGDERISEVKVSATLQLHVAGFATASASTSMGKLVPSTGAFQSTVAGLQDAFVGRLNIPLSAFDFLTFFGTANGNEGWPFDAANPFYADMNSMGLDIDSTGRVMIASMSWGSGLPTKNPYSASNGGFGDNFIAIFDPTKTGANQLEYGSYFGGTGNDMAESAVFDPSRKNHIALGGWTYSSNLPTTPGCFGPNFVGPTGTTAYNDAYLCWLDISKAGAAQVAYCSYFTGQSWEGAAELYLDRRGTAHFGGWGDGTTSTTAGAWQRSAPTGVAYQGFFARIHPDGMGSKDLVYGTLVGGTSGVDNSFVSIIAEGGKGGSWIGGNTAANSFPSLGGPYQTVAGNRDACIGHIWGLNHGVAVHGTASPTACAGALNHGAEGSPSRGNTDFALSAWGAQPNSPGFLGLGTSLSPAVAVCGAQLLINPLLVVPAAADAQGQIRVPAPIAAGLPANLSLATQFVFGNTGCCLTASHRLDIRVW